MPEFMPDGSERPIVALVGAPNAGKSTLFNRLVGARRALVTDFPGMTRDRIYGRVSLGQGAVTLCDTGGIPPEIGDGLDAAVLRQTEEALREASALLLIVDGRASGPGALDAEIAGAVRKTGRPAVIVVNKIDGPAQETAVASYHGFGLGDPVSVSAEHGLGIGDLISRIEEALPGLSEETGEESEPISVAVAGRPNVGKSSLLNRIFREDRLTVSDVPGTTRDTVDTIVKRGEKTYRLVDTAGIRRKGKTSGVAEVLSVVAARKALERADVVILVVDAGEPLTSQDQTIAGYAFAAHRPIVIVGNKWDLSTDREEATKRLEQEIARRFRFASYAPVITVSARTGQRVEKIFPLVDAVDEAGRQLIPTPDLNRFLQREISSGRGPKLFYMTQTGIRPPSFLVFAHDASALHFSQRRRLANRLRASFAFGPTPLVLKIRSRTRGSSARA